MLTYDYDLSAGKHHWQRFIYTEQYKAEIKPHSELLLAALYLSPENDIIFHPISSCLSLSIPYKGKENAFAEKYTLFLISKIKQY